MMNRRLFCGLCIILPFASEIVGAVPEKSLIQRLLDASKLGSNYTSSLGKEPGTTLKHSLIEGKILIDRWDTPIDTSSVRVTDNIIIHPSNKIRVKNEVQPALSKDIREVADNLYDILNKNTTLLGKLNEDAKVKEAIRIIKKCADENTEKTIAVSSEYIWGAKIEYCEQMPEDKALLYTSTDLYDGSKLNPDCVSMVSI